LAPQVVAPCDCPSGSDHGKRQVLPLDVAQRDLPPIVIGVDALAVRVAPADQAPQLRRRFSPAGSVKFGRVDAEQSNLDAVQFEAIAVNDAGFAPRRRRR